MKGDNIVNKVTYKILINFIFQGWMLCTSKVTDGGDDGGSQVLLSWRILPCSSDNLDLHAYLVTYRGSPLAESSYANSATTQFLDYASPHSLVKKKTPHLI